MNKSNQIQAALAVYALSYPIQVSDIIVVELKNVVVVSGYVINARVRLTDGTIVPVQQDVKNQPAGTTIRQTLPLPAGDLIALEIHTTTYAQVPGSAFASVNIIVNSDLISAPSFVLVQGYIGGSQKLLWPYNVGDSVSGDILQSVGINANGPAGPGISILAPNGWRGLIKHVYIVLTTDANVANRRLSLVFNNAAGADPVYTLNVTQPASQTYIYELYVGGPQQNFAPNIQAPLPDGVEFDYTAGFVAQVANVQAGDNFDNVILTYWPRVV